MGAPPVSGAVFPLGAAWRPNESTSLQRGARRRRGYGHTPQALPPNLPSALFRGSAFTPLRCSGKLSTMNPRRMPRRTKARLPAVGLPPKTIKTSRRGQRVGEILAQLEKLYPDARCTLHHQSPLQLLVATILSAQCTDVRVNLVTPLLFARFPDAAALAQAALGEIEAIIRSTGFFRAKAKSIQAAARQLVDQHGGQVPETMAALTALPGVGRKTANVVLGNAFGQNVGVVVDTHVGRLARRLGLTRQEDPEKVEQDLMALIPREQWTRFAHQLIWHGRQVCAARRPDCGHCPLAELCPSAFGLDGGHRGKRGS